MPLEFLKLLALMIIIGISLLLSLNLQKHSRSQVVAACEFCSTDQFLTQLSSVMAEFENRSSYQVLTQTSSTLAACEYSCTDRFLSLIKPMLVVVKITGD